MTGGLEAHKINIWRRGYPHEGTPRGKCQRKGVHSISPLLYGHMQPKQLLEGSSKANDTKGDQEQQMRARNEVAEWGGAKINPWIT